MARSAEALPILEAAGEWRRACLLGHGSVFTTERVWTAENVEHLVREYVENLDEGEGDFFQKLEGQLASAPPGAAKLAAEMLWVMYLIVSESASSAKTKRYQIRKVWSWSGETLPEDHPQLGELLASGVAHPGTAYHTHRWRELLFFVTAMRDWFAMDRRSQDSLLADPWRFAEWLESREHAKNRQLRHVLLYLLFPDHFERIVSATHKARIVKSFRKKWNAANGSIDYKDRIALDREVLRIRERLEEEGSPTDDPVDFYREDIREAWEEGPPPKPESELARWYRETIGEHRIWVINAGASGEQWPRFKEDGLIALPYDYLDDLSGYQTREEVGQAITEHDGRQNPSNDSLAAWQFCHEMEVGDVVIAKVGKDRLLGMGRVTGPYRYVIEGGDWPHERPVEWAVTGSWDLDENTGPITPKRLTDFTRYKPWVQEAWKLIHDEEGPKPSDPYTLERALDGLFMTEAELREIMETLSQRKNVVLEGPPGVGKTFIARRLAWLKVGRKDTSQIQMVQFHQSYAYEDFIQGWRPTASAGFERRDGVFFRFCKIAAANPESPHVFLIDEINRGNLSRIFGELLVLIEADKRGPAYAIPLTYSSDGDEPFFVPENVFVIGMMNTADRSLAIVDYALRRRFGFARLQPAFGSEPFQQVLLSAGVEEPVLRRIEERMTALNQVIREDRKNLGPGFEVGHSYFVPSQADESLDESWYERIIRTQVAPLLREYWFDRPEVLEQHVEQLLAP